MEDNLKLNNEHFIQKFKDAAATIGNRTGPNVKWMDEGENDDKLTLPKFDLSTGKPTLARVLNDFESGICCVLGQPNAGKTTLLIQMITHSLKLNPNLLIVDLSLDDPLKKRYVQYIANLTGLHYSQIYNQTNLTDTQKDAIQKARERLFGWIEEGRLMPFQAKEKLKTTRIRAGGKEEAHEQTFNTRHYRTLINLMRKLRSNNSEKKIAIFVDAWNNLDYSGLHGTSDLNQMNLMLDMLQEEADGLNIMMIVSAHARKTMGGKKLTAEDIKGTKNMEYNANCILIARNEYRENAYVEPLMYEQDDKEFPILTLEVAKTKVSSWDFPLFYPLFAGSCQLGILDEFEYQMVREVYMGKRK